MKHIKEIRRILRESCGGNKILQSVVCEIDGRHQVVSAELWQKLLRQPENMLYNYENPNGILCSRLHCFKEIK